MRQPKASVAIVGVGETQYRRRSERPLGELIVEATRTAIADAGLDPSEIDGYIPATASPAADEMAAVLGAARRFTAPPGYVAGAGTVGAVEQAQLAIGAGLADTVLVYYGYQGSKAGGPYAFHAEDPVKANLEMPFGWYGQPVYFAAWAQRYCHQFSVKPEQFSPVAVAARRWAGITPGAQKSDPIDHDGYLQSPMIATPLRALDCCLISDGAAAYIVTSLERARSLRRPPAVVSGVACAAAPTTLTSMFTQHPPLPALAAAASGASAFAEAGISVGDVDLAEIYDCFSISMILQLEELGFCGPGEGFDFCADGRIEPGGSLPINTNGGHLAYAYMPGMNHVVEAVRQIRGERGPAQVPDAEVAVVAGLGGNDHATLVLTADR
jgi:acetyl-CoA acetyltransferase